MTKPRPKTGEERRVHQPLKIDLLPQETRDAILALRDRGLAWPQVEAQSAKPYSKEWQQDGGGFVNWESLDLKILEEFPEMKLPKSTLHRWFDLRVTQARKQVLVESERARAWAAEFATKSLPDANASVINALRDQVFSMMQGVGKMDSTLFVQGLMDLTLAMTRMQRVELQAKRVDVDARKIKLLEDREKQAKERLDQVTQAAAKKGTGQFGIEDINLLRERVFGLPPLQVPK